LVFETSMILGSDNRDLHYPFFLFSATLFLYGFHRVYRSDFRSAQEKLSARHLWIKNNRVLFYSVLVSSAIGTLYSALFFISFHILFSLLPVTLISIGYTIPFIPWKGRLLRLRDIPGIKVFLISAVLGLTTVLLPVLSMSRPDGSLFSPAVFILFLRRVFFVFAITIPFDIRDIEYDRRNNTKTLPVLLGESRSKQLAILALAAFALLAVYQYLEMKNTKLEYMLALLLSAVISGWTILKSRRNQQDLFYSLYLEGMMFLQCFLVIGASRFSL
jgi:4-hydroxybenzoate polyprenyltransferase